MVSVMASLLSGAKHRARARRRARGAVLFIVSMTLAVLASLGLYALSAASVEVKTSGYGRQNAQTHYLSEYGVAAAANDMNGTNAPLYLSLMKDPTKRDTNCVSLLGVQNTAAELSKACRRMGAAEMASVWGTNSYGNKVKAVEKYDGTTVAGSLGPYALAGDFFVEITDPAQAAPVAGNGTNMPMCYVQYTVTSVGVTQPDTNLIQSLPPTAFFGSEGLETSRGRITAGPQPCPK